MEKKAEVQKSEVWLKKCRVGNYEHLTFGVDLLSFIFRVLFPHRLNVEIKFTFDIFPLFIRLRSCIMLCPQSSACLLVCPSVRLSVSPLADPCETNS